MTRKPRKPRDLWPDENGMPAYRCTATALPGRAIRVSSDCYVCAKSTQRLIAWLKRALAWQRASRSSSPQRRRAPVRARRAPRC